MRQKFLNNNTQSTHNSNKLFTDYHIQTKNNPIIQSNLFRNKSKNQQLNISRNFEFGNKITFVNDENSINNKNEYNKPKKSQIREYSKKLFLEKRRKERLEELKPIKLDLAKNISVYSLVSPKKDEILINNENNTSKKANNNKSHSINILFKKNNLTQTDDTKNSLIDKEKQLNNKNKKDIKNIDYNNRNHSDYNIINTERNYIKEFKRKSEYKINYNYLRNKIIPLSSSSSRKSVIFNKLNEEKLHIISHSEVITNNKDIKINLENIYILETLLQNIIEKLKEFQPNYNECFEWLNYFYNYELFKNIFDLFLDSNRDKIDKFIKIEILIYCMNYDISYSNKFKEVAILLQSMLNIIHFNFLIIIKFILQKIKFTKENNEWIKKLENILKTELSMNWNKEKLCENDVIEIYEKHNEKLSELYKKILDNIYSNFHHPELYRLCFPYILKNKNAVNNKIIASNFFYDAFEKIKLYSIQDIKNFYNIFLFRIPDPNASFILSYRLESSSIKNSENQNKLNSFFLPSRDPKFKFSLVIDLDETLIHFKRSEENSKKGILILRPYLFYFLSSMKKEYELILFSFGNEKYVDPIIEMIEKKEKYFSYRLYRKHAVLSGKNFVKDLSRLGRDLKTILIIDNLPQAFKLQKENGIWVKAFYGDCKGDNKTLKKLGDVLERIKMDALETKDIRISLAKEQNNLMSQFSIIKNEKK